MPLFTRTRRKSLVKCLYNFCSVRQDPGDPIWLQNDGDIINLGLIISRPMEEKYAFSGRSTKLWQVFTTAVVQQAIDKAARRLGYASVLEVQARAINSIVAAKDVFVSLPTGTGKSLCFALVPLVFDELLGYVHSTSIAIIVSPLIALMKDQVSLCHWM